MGYNPQESLQNKINIYIYIHKYHGYTVRATPNCPLIQGQRVRECQGYFFQPKTPVLYIYIHIHMRKMRCSRKCYKKIRKDTKSTPQFHHKIHKKKTVPARKNVQRFSNLRFHPSGWKSWKVLLYDLLGHGFTQIFVLGNRRICDLWWFIMIHFPTFESYNIISYKMFLRNQEALSRSEKLCPKWQPNASGREGVIQSSAWRCTSGALWVGLELGGSNSIPSSKDWMMFFCWKMTPGGQGWVF